MSYAKLHGSLLASSLMGEPLPVRWLFVAMLAMADRDGVVEASLPGLAHLARLTMDETQGALEVLSAPDPHSRTPDHDGRRIVQVPGGWRLVTYDQYRDKASADEAREKANARKQRWRDRVAAGRSSTPVHGGPRSSTYSGSGSGSGSGSVQQKRAPRAPARAIARPGGVDEQTWADFLQIRKAKRAPLTETALAAIVAEATKAGVTIEQALAECAARGWASWRADWQGAGGGHARSRNGAVPKSIPVGSYLRPGESPVQDL